MQIITGSDIMQRQSYGIVHTGTFNYEGLSQKEMKSFYQSNKSYLYNEDDRKCEYNLGAIKTTMYKYSSRMKIFVDFIEMMDSLDVKENDLEFISNEITSLIKKPDKLFLNRIDFRIDVKLESQKAVEDVFGQYQKALTGYNRLIRIGEKNGENITSKSLYYKTKSNPRSGQESLRINIYDKFKEREAKSKKSDLYENMIRYELQLMNRHLIYKNSRGIEKYIENYLKNGEIIKYFSKYILPIVYNGNFYTVERIKDILKERDLSDNERYKVVQFVRTISEGGMDAAYLCYSRYLFNKYISLLGDDNINPIPLPSNSKVSMMENPLNAFLTDFTVQDE